MHTGASDTMASGAANSLPGCLFWRKLLRPGCFQLGSSFLGTVPSSFVTWYACSFQMRRVRTQLPAVSPKTRTPDCAMFVPSLHWYSALPLAYALETTTMSAWPSLSTSATSGYSMSVPVVLHVSKRTLPVGPS